ncbi:MAG: hypothetical protein GQE15_16235 [Archangiaceae bacterium]|nr:hypothetical protein [Archangiaceae bacterium]
MVAPLLFIVLTAAPSARLEYSVAPGIDGCPDERWVHASVGARLGRDPFVDEAPTRVVVNISRGAPPALVALVEVTRPDGRVGKRTLDSPTGDCLELASAVELAVSLALDPASKRPPVVEAPPAPPPVKEVVVVQAPPVVAPPPAITPFGRVGALMTAGGLPGFSGGLLIGGGVLLRHFSIGLEGRAHLPTRVLTSDSTTTTFLALASLVPCLELGRFSGCLVGSVGPFQFDDGAQRQTSVMAQGGARVQVGFEPLQQLRLVPWLEGGVVVTRTTLLRNGVPLWVTWPVAVSGGLFVEWRPSS